MVRRRRRSVWLASLEIELVMEINDLGIEPHTFLTYSDIVTTTPTGRLKTVLNKINGINPNIMVIVRCCNPEISPLKVPGLGLVKIDENLGIFRYPNPNCTLVKGSVP